MNSSGYSGTPLPKKLGLADGKRLLMIEALPDVIEILGEFEQPSTPPYDVILLFTRTREHLALNLATAISQLEKNGGLWICWPKRSSKVPTDITEDTLRDVILKMGLVDNKVCAVTEVWSGLRFVWRKENR